VNLTQWRPWGFGLLWLAFVVYSFGFAPPDSPETATTIARLVTGDWASLNPLVVALFNLMGIWPMVYGAVLLADGRGQRVRAWPFLAGSFAVGAFALLPYGALRDRNPTFVGELSPTLKFWDGRNLAIALNLGAIALLAYGFAWGNWGDFWQQWRTSRFIHVMSLDFVALSLLFPTLLPDDLARRGMGQNAGLWRAIVWLPLLGPLTYLMARSRLTGSLDYPSKIPTASQT
jgi:hypothetical protein